MILLDYFANMEQFCYFTTWPLSTHVLPTNLAKSQNRQFGCYDDRISLKFDRHLGSAAAEAAIKF